ncbi:hypothetical protein D4S03_12520 [bacterium]|nr:MAG: hypothetical protein D4S03_12520 [bacterium]
MDQWQIGVGNSPVPYGIGQHGHSIPEKVQGRQQKMQGDENIYSLSGLIPRRLRRKKGFGACPEVDTLHLGEFLPGNSAGGVGR